jgi:hypothetical protein
VWCGEEHDPQEYFMPIGDGKVAVVKPGVHCKSTIEVVPVDDIRPGVVIPPPQKPKFDRATFMRELHKKKKEQKAKECKSPA